MLKRGTLVGCIASACFLVIFTVQLIPSMLDGQQIVRIRNSLLYQEGGNFDWTPSDPPDWFSVESSPVPPFFEAVGNNVAPENKSSDSFDVALEIARHLHPFGRSKGGMIAASSESTYRQIRTTGAGYCADYTQVFTALAHSVGLSVREWGISFDKYSGDGHAFNEVYSNEYRKWIFLDSFYGFYITDSTGIPLSFQAIKRELQARNDEELQVEHIGPEMFSFESDSKALDYLRRGAALSYLWTGNDIFTYESHPLVMYSSRVSRSLEQLVAILIGAHPEIMLDTESPAAVSAIMELSRVRFNAFGAVASGGLLIGFFSLMLILHRSEKRVFGGCPRDVAVARHKER